MNKVKWQANVCLQLLIILLTHLNSSLHGSCSMRKKVITQLLILVESLEHRINSCSYLDRVSHTSDQLSEEENDREIERAIDEILKYDFRNIYKKVVQKT